MQEPERTQPEHSDHEKMGPRNGLLLALGIGAGVLALVSAFQPQQQAVPAVAQPATTRQQPAVQLADFGGEQPSPDARLLANWVVATRDNAQHPFMLVDKKHARVYVFSPDARLKGSAPALLGEAQGDEILPGAGAKDPEQLEPEEKTTPAGRFLAEPGVNADHEDVIWVDYDNGISMHRVRARVPGERRLERLATPATDDNRISFGCINLPAAFYDQVARPLTGDGGAIVYVLPEAKTVQEVFGAYDVTDPAQVAAARQRTLASTARGKDTPPRV